MDTICLTGITVSAIIGVYPKERQAKQPLSLDIVFPVDGQQAAQTDDIKATVDYGTMVEKLTVWTQDSDFQLIESLAEMLASKLLATFSLAWLELTVHKINVFEQVKDIALTIRREQ